MAADDRPFRFYDNRQKYLSFVTTCNEKWKIAERAIGEVRQVKPTPPALRIYDAGMGDGTLLSHVMRATHKLFPTVPLYVVGKEISLEDIRMSLEKLPDRFVEHPATVVVFTNLSYRESPWLSVGDPGTADQVNWIDVPLTSSTAADIGDQLRALDQQLVDGWQVRASEKTGNPLHVKPSALVLYREDHAFVMEDVRPRPGKTRADYDLVLVSQPWRSRSPAAIKVRNILEPMCRALAPGGRAVIAQSSGNDPGLELIRRIWPDEDPFPVDRHELMDELRQRLGAELPDFEFHAISDAEAIVSYEMHTLPDEIQSNIGTSTLFAAWNAAVYVAQIEDERLESAMASGDYLPATEAVLQKFGGLWFNDEVFVVSRKPDRHRSTK